MVGLSCPHYADMGNFGEQRWGLAFPGREFYHVNMSRTGKSTYRILGIDPGLNITGYGAVDFALGDPAVVEAGTIQSDGKANLAGRISQIHRDLAEIIEELRPDLIAVEQLYAHYKHPRTAILMGHARGAILLAAEQAGVAVTDLPATKVKKSLTGNGHASKQQVQRTIKVVCKLDALPQPPDVADALAIALCAGRQISTRKSLETGRVVL